MILFVMLNLESLGLDACTLYDLELEITKQSI